MLGEICRDHELNCEFLRGDPPVLRIRSLSEEGYPLPPGYAQPITMSLRNADLQEVLKSFSAISGTPFKIPADLEGAVSLHIRATPWSLALTEICRLEGCRVEWGKDLIRIVVAMKATEMALINMSLNQANTLETLGLFTQIFDIFGAPSVEVDVDPAVGDAFSVELKHVTWQQALDLICEELACDWRLDYGNPVTLRLFPRDSEEAHSVAAEIEKSGAGAKTMAYRYVAPGGPVLEGTVAFTWANPIHVLGSQGPYRARLTWIPFGPELSVVLPWIERCENAQSSVSLMDPIVLPIEKAIRLQAEGISVTLSPADDDASGSPRQIPEATACGPARKGEILATVRRFLDPDEGLAGPELAGPGLAEPELARPERQLKLESYLLIRPVEAIQPIAAVIALGGDLDGRQSLALLQPSADGVEVEMLSVALGESVEKIIRAEGRPFELRIEYLEEDAKKE